MTRIRYAMTDEAIAKELGRRLAQLRIGANVSQDQIAADIGIDRGRISRLEHAGAGKLSTLIAVLRHLEQLELLEQFLPETGIISPLQIAQARLPYLTAQAPQRARPKKTGPKQAVSAPDQPDDKEDDLGW